MASVKAVRPPMPFCANTNDTKPEQSQDDSSPGVRPIGPPRWYGVPANDSAVSSSVIDDVASRPRVGDVAGSADQRAVRSD